MNKSKEDLFNRAIKAIEEGLERYHNKKELPERDRYFREALAVSNIYIMQTNKEIVSLLEAINNKLTKEQDEQD